MSLRLHCRSGNAWRTRYGYVAPVYPSHGPSIRTGVRLLLINGGFRAVGLLASTGFLINGEAALFPATGAAAPPYARRQCPQCFYGHPQHWQQGLTFKNASFLLYNHTGCVAGGLPRPITPQELNTSVLCEGFRRIE